MIATVTHARIRAAQGDLAGARRVLLEILRRAPEHAEARELLDRFAGRGGAARPETPEHSLPAPQAATAADLSTLFRDRLHGGAASRAARARRLRRWLDRIRAG